MPGTTSATIASSEVPSARLSGIPSQPARSGTITSPPPMPRRPETRPARAPIPPRIGAVAGRAAVCPLALPQDRDRLPPEQDGGHDQEQPRVDRAREPGAERGADDAGADQPGRRAHVDLSSTPVGERPREGGREDHGERGREGDDRRRSEQHLDAGRHHDPASDAEQSREDAGDEADRDPDRDVRDAQRSISAARPSTSRSPRYAARLSARSSGNQRISSISSSRSSTLPPVWRIRKKWTVLRIRTSSHT